MAASHVKSDHIANLGTQPISVPTAGEGAAGRLHSVIDAVAITADGTATVGSTARLARIPVTAKINRLELRFPAGLGQGAAETLAFDVKVAFSDSLYDGTPDGVRGLAPAAAKDGTVAAVTAAGANVLWGSVTVSENGQLSDVTFNGNSATYPITYTMAPLWSLFNFVNGRGEPQNPGGKFDIVLVTKTAAKTAGSGTVLARLVWVE
jgi:hypothetical protein